jgi:ABC-type spermidine/putrescine transport system permease subunit II
MNFVFLLLITCVPSLLFQVKNEEDRIRHIYKVMVLGSMICSDIMLAIALILFLACVSSLGP